MLDILNIHNEVRVNPNESGHTVITPYCGSILPLV